MHLLSSQAADDRELLASLLKARDKHAEVWRLNAEVVRMICYCCCSVCRNNTQYTILPSHPTVSVSSYQE